MAMESAGESPCKRRRAFSRDSCSYLTSCSSRGFKIISLIFLSILCCEAQNRAGEAFFNGTSWLTIRRNEPSLTTNLYHVGLSFRTCGPAAFGTLFSQVDSGDRLSLELLPADQGGRLKLSLAIAPNTGYTSDVAFDLADNRWHNVDLRFSPDGFFQLQLDSELVSIVNASDISSSPLFRPSSPSSTVVIGQGYTGCLLAGPSIRFPDDDSQPDGILFGRCPIPLTGNCSRLGLDACFVQPCQNGGRCIAGESSTDFQCQCAPRYLGSRCEIDSGPLCDRPGPICLNGGACRENINGNGTTCVCPPGFTGTACENPILFNECEINRCMNNGTCYVPDASENRERHLCVCQPGFSGRDCEIDDDDCDPSPCLNGATCSDGTDSFSCDCDGTGFTGDRCQLKIDHCASAPCQNDAICHDRPDGFVCHCKAGFSGIKCQQQVSSRITNFPADAQCEPDTCLNGGTCRQLETQGIIECECPAGFEGARCQIDIDDCSNVTCPDDSICLDGVNSHSCICRPGFTGQPPDCIQIDECDSAPCRNNATCSDLIDGYSCSCLDGFSGVNCDVDIDECQTSPCLNGATCQDGINSRLCTCPVGFRGESCEIDIDECFGNPCLHSTSCIDLIGDYRCDCEAGWSGRNCDVDIDECASSPCQNNGTCTNELNAFVCECPNGFLGERCEINRNDCEPNLCRNNGTCLDGVANYTCLCPPEFMGRHCEDEFDACASLPCQNGASCITTRPQHNFYCECLPGFEGLHCENNIDECFSVQCSDGKQCFDLINGYECRCPVGFTGPMCKENINECAENPCQNGGSCIDGIGNYTCSCLQGFTGRHCEDDIDECTILRPCVYGICQNTIGSYQCYCRPGFSGDNCNLEFDECLSHPCLNNGTCNNLINGYECVCAPGFTGKDCDININECESSPCQNNGTCIDGIAVFTCICQPGFTGSRCEININECDSSPCLNDGICLDGINSYECECSDTGFKGEHCEINVDDCESAPCVHGSQCIDLVKDYSCKCFAGYEGKNCEKDVNECSTEPCQNGATCLERSNRTLYDLDYFSDQFSYNTSGGYVCRCLPGFEGDDCQIDIDECALANPRPCKFGTCIDGINNYTCQCHPGYEGDDCENEIDECDRHQPCVNGNCVDLVADYQCICPATYGGKNCSVELLGCLNVTCLHGGTCVPFLEEETIHRFTCQCPFGFHGDLCQHATTMSFSGSSYMPVQTNRDEGYDLSFRFRTTLPNGLLAVGQGQTYYRLELLDGQLNLHSSLLNKWEGVFLGSNLNDAEWQSVRVRFNFTHLLLVVNDQEAMYPINPVESINSTETSFGMTVLGGATSFLRILAQGLPFFVGCMENVVVNGNWVVPSASSSPSASTNILFLPGVGVEIGCPRKDLCRPNPCQNQGRCNDLWTFFNCSCQRPYLGDTCQYSYTPATFGHENSTNSLVSVSITPQERLALSNSMDISMFIRTREEDGLIFYLGTPPAAGNAGDSSATWPSYIAAELQKGRLLVVANFGDVEQVFLVRSAPLNDGNRHLIQVIRDPLKLQVKINGTVGLEDLISSFRPLQAEVLFLGGLPPESRIRRRRRLGRQTSTSLASQLASGANTLEARNFKGVLQDIQIRSGNMTRIVEIFPLETRSSEIPEQLGTVQRNQVLEGVVSDNTCRNDPCVNGGNCTVTWNDFMCICPSGFKGKTCHELEFCAIHECPSGGTCQNLNDGYECLTSATFNGVNSTIGYSLAGFNSNTDLTSTISFSYRSKGRGGTVLVIQNDASSVRLVRVDVENQGVVTRWIARGDSTVEQSVMTVPEALDGEWHTVTLNLSALNVNFTDLLSNGRVTLGGGNSGEEVAESTVTPFGTASENPESTTSDSGTNSTPSATLPPTTLYRGCLNEVRISGLLLPFFPASELAADPSVVKFKVVTSLEEIERQCRLCYDHECQNGASCADPLSNFTCSCLPGFEGDLCQINIDECVGNGCLNGVCVDGIANYTCNCDVGWTGWLCDVEINECESNPCQNDGVCKDLIGRYECNCTEDFVGVNCEKPRVVTCANGPCKRGDCSNIYDPVSELAVNFTCACPFAYEGSVCETEIDYCDRLEPCSNGATCEPITFEPGFICTCAEGFTGENCEIDINECTQKPCLNGGRCIDGVNNFTCECDGTGFEGYLCEVDIDECRDDPCVRGRCSNLPGSFICHCDSEDDCGRRCDRKDPCKQKEPVCFNGAACTAYCDDPIDNSADSTPYKCTCLDGFQGRNCSLASPSTLEPNLKLVAIILPIVAAILLIALIGGVVFVMMARNKRATRGTYSPSRQEMFSPRVEMGQVMKPPPEERLI